MIEYRQFIHAKEHFGLDSGFAASWLPEWLYDFQRHLIAWSVQKGRAAIFADCGLGKTPMQLVWAQNVVEHTNKPVLILTPLAVSHQTVREARKFGLDCERSNDGRHGVKGVVVTNYERLHHFNWQDFSGCACDESSILKNFDGQTKAMVTDFMRKLPYRSLWTATAAPNDYIELGTSSEALGNLGHIDMLQRFFKADNDAFAQGGGNGARRFSKNPFGGKFRFRGHAEQDFWRWVCSWARAVRKPSDLGFADGRFVLPDLITHQHVIQATERNPEMLIDLPAVTLAEQRQERRRTLKQRVEKAAELASAVKGPSVLWCHLNDEGDELTEATKGAVQVSGDDSDEEKEERFAAFEAGQIEKLVTKPTIAGFGLNWQHCAHATFFPSHSFEQWYQSVRRCWRFGQPNPVTVDIVTSECESRVMGNLQRKAMAADEMFARLVAVMNNELKLEKHNRYTTPETKPIWL